MLHILFLYWKIYKFSNKETKYVTLLKYQNKSLEFAKKVKYDLYSFIYPDSVFGENHFNSIIKKINDGYKAVLCPGPLIIFEEFHIWNSSKIIKGPGHNTAL